MSGRVLAPEAYKLFGTPRRLADGRMTTYGCGIQTSTNRGGDEILSHGGGDAGFRGAELLVPRTHSAVVVLSNRDDADPWDLVTDIVRLLNKEHRPPPLKVAGPRAEDVARELLAAMQSGQVDCSRLGDDFNVFLTDAKLQGASARLRRLGAPTDVHVEDTHERGGMEAATVRFTFASCSGRAGGRYVPRSMGILRRFSGALVLAATSCAAPAQPLPSQPSTPSPAQAAASVPPPSGSPRMPAPQPRTDEERARDLVGKLAARDFAGAVATFDDRMSAALPVDKLEGVWSRVESQAGAFQKIDAVEAKPSGDARVVLVRASFERVPLVLRVVFQGSDRVAGFFVAPGDAAPEWQPPPYAKPDAFEERAVQVGTSPPLPATLTVPKGAKSFPVIVLVHGSGPNDRDETLGALKVFKDLAFGLASRGVAVLRYDKRTRVDPSAAVRTQKDEVDDAAHAAAAMVRTQPGVDASRIVLLGHSQGGYLAPRIAQADPAIKGLVLLAASTRPLEDSLLSQLTYLATLDPTDAKLGDAIEQARRFKAAVESPSLKADDAVQVPFSSPIPGSYFLDVRDYHPEKVASALRIPMLVLQGERDYQVTVADDFGAWKTALAHKKNATLRSYPGLNHAFAPGDGPPSPADYARPGHVDAAVVDEIAGWVTGLK